jgi:hypothetical protein
MEMLKNKWLWIGAAVLILLYFMVIKKKNPLHMFTSNASASGSSYYEGDDSYDEFGRRRGRGRGMMFKEKREARLREKCSKLPLQEEQSPIM